MGTTNHVLCTTVSNTGAEYGNYVPCTNTGGLLFGSGIREQNTVSNTGAEYGN